jgi:hypothetical protein
MDLDVFFRTTGATGCDDKKWIQLILNGAHLSVFFEPRRESFFEDVCLLGCVRRVIWQTITDVSEMVAAFAIRAIRTSERTVKIYPTTLHGNPQTVTFCGRRREISCSSFELHKRR